MTYITIREILDDILEHPLLQNVTLENALRHSLKFMRIMGNPVIFEDKQAMLEIKDYRAALPCDFYELKGVRVKDSSCKYVSLTPSTSTFNDNCKSLTYKLQGSVIMTSVKEGEIEIAYRAIKVDSEGYPMIPDDEQFIRALELYIKRHYFTILFDQNKISPAVLQNVQQEYAWAVGQASNHFKLPTPDEMENLSRMWNRLIVDLDAHRKGFRTLSSKEIIHTH